MTSDADINRPGSLGNVFGPSAAGGLGAILPSRSATAPPPAPPAQAPPAAAPERKTREPEPASEPPAQDDDPTTYPVAVYLLPAAIAAAADRRDAARADNASVVYDAIDAVRSRLPDLVAARRAAPSRPGSLFPGRQFSSSRAAAERDGRRKLWFFQATDPELAIIDQLQKSSGARSRSELISCAMEAHLLRRRGRAR